MRDCSGIGEENLPSAHNIFVCAEYRFNCHEDKTRLGDRVNDLLEDVKLDENDVPQLRKIHWHKAVGIRS